MKPSFNNWMQRNGSLLAVGLVAVLAASACASAAATNNPPPPTEALVPATSVPAETAPTATGEVAVTVPTQAVAVIQPVATSRGPNLEATDPTTVNLASGQLQLVEFFRFT